jgi:hypothetical protein
VQATNTQKRLTCENIGFKRISYNADYAIIRLPIQISIEITHYLDLRIMKQNIAFALLLSLLVPILAACGSSSQNSTPPQAGLSGTPTTIPPLNLDFIFGRDEPTATPEQAQEQPPQQPIVQRPAGWSDETHSNQVSANYTIVLPEDRINELVISFTPEEWAKLQANLREVVGARGSNEQYVFTPTPEPFFPVQEEPTELLPTATAPLPFDTQVPTADVADPPGLTSVPATPSTEIEASPTALPEAPVETTLPEQTAEPEAPELPTPEPMPETTPIPLDNPVFPSSNGYRAQTIAFEQVSWSRSNAKYQPLAQLIWVEADISFNGLVWHKVGFSYWGTEALLWNWHNGAQQLPFVLDFAVFDDKYPEIKGQRFYGVKQLTFADYSLLPEPQAQALQIELSARSRYSIVVDSGQGAWPAGIYSVGQTNYAAQD